MRFELGYQQASSFMKKKSLNFLCMTLLECIFVYYIMIMMMTMRHLIRSTDNVLCLEFRENMDHGLTGTTDSDQGNCPGHGHA